MEDTFKLSTCHTLSNLLESLSVKLLIYFYLKCQQSPTPSTPGDWSLYLGVNGYSIRFTVPGGL